MPVTISRSLPYEILFFLCVGVSLFPNYELTFAVWFLTFLITLKRKYSKTILKYVAIFAGILFIAFVSSWFNSAQLFVKIRDFTYLMKPILGLLVGYQLLRNSSERALKTIVYSGVLIALAHLTVIFLTVLLNFHLDIHQIRKASGYFSDYEIYTLILILFNKRFNIRLSKKQKTVFLIVVFLSTFFYFSRTNFIQFFLLLLPLKGYFTVTRRSLLYLLSAIVSTLLIYGTIYYSNPRRNGKGLEAFLYKIKIAPIEPFKTKIDTEDWKDFNDNYRSYENIITVRQVTSKGNRAIYFGEGFGSTLNLGRKVLSNDDEYVQYIPYVHNGFMTVFLKSGLLGVFLSLLFIIILFRQKKSNIESVKQINYLLVGTSVFLIVSNWVFLGLYLKLDNKSIVIGFLIALKEILQKENQIQESIENE